VPRCIQRCTGGPPEPLQEMRPLEPVGTLSSEGKVGGLQPIVVAGTVKAPVGGSNREVRYIAVPTIDDAPICYWRRAA
jgi:hypothetical protein